MLYDVKIDTQTLSTGKTLTWYEGTAPNGLAYRASQVGASGLLIWVRRSDSVKWKRSRMLPERFLAQCGMPATP